MAGAVAREEHHRYAADRAESERSGRLPIGGPHHLAARDIEIGELCQPGAADDREHVRSGFLYGVDFRKVAPGPGYVHSAAEHVAVGQLQTDEVRDNGFIAADVLVGEHGAVERRRTERFHTVTDSRERFAAVQDVVQHEHGAVLYVFPRRHRPYDVAAGSRVAVARCVYVVELERETQPRQ